MKALDVGCGGGVLLHKLKEMFPKVRTYGVEPNEMYSDLARKRSGATRIETAYFNEKIFQERFDLIVSSDVLEHVDDPCIILGDMYKSLSKEGVLFLEIPSPTNFSKLDNCEHDIFNMAHHVFYTEEILEKYLEQAGFVRTIISDIEYSTGVWKLRSLSFKEKI
jgi:2-polyprenyl-3-methyl-5-hydroxy-6-metoxy-1,4-benzoquinol methylase